MSYLFVKVHALVYFQKFSKGLKGLGDSILTSNCKRSSDPNIKKVIIIKIKSYYYIIIIPY